MLNFMSGLQLMRHKLPVNKTLGFFKNNLIFKFKHISMIDMLIKKYKNEDGFIFYIFYIVYICTHSNIIYYYYKHLLGTVFPD